MYRNYLISKDKPLVTSKYGKWKTAFQHVMVIVILLNNPTQEIINLIVSFNAIYAAGTGLHYVAKNGF
jgi:CDP-diacylglycerol--glycerol-3-phosphate 3-phosphatidyltransferase